LVGGKHYFQIKAYMLIASTNPVMAYYHDGYVRMSLLEYDEKAPEFQWITNLEAVRKQWQGTKFSRMSQLEIMDYFTWSFKNLQDYLLKKKIIKIGEDQEDWIQEYLKPQMKKALIHLIRMSQGRFWNRSSSIFELFDVDFTLDEDLQVWFLEANANPLINGFTQGTIELMNGMLEDGFKVILGLVRSRMKRVVGYINSLTKMAEREDGIVIPEMEKRREEFRELTRNKFEVEFVPNFANGFERIVDETGLGSDDERKKYINYIKSECL